MQWYALHLRPRTEKKLAEFSQLNHFEHYLPLRRETKVYQRRKVTVDKPVFPSYFFVAFDQERRVELLKTNNILRIIEVEDQQRLVHELDQLRQALTVDSTLGAINKLQKGKYVRITGGPFMGVEGVITGIKGDNKVWLNVDMVGQAVPVEVAPEFLELLD